MFFQKYWMLSFLNKMTKINMIFTLNTAKHKCVKWQREMEISFFIIIAIIIDIFINFIAKIQNLSNFFFSILENYCWHLFVERRKNFHKSSLNYKYVFSNIWHCKKNKKYSFFFSIIDVEFFFEIIFEVDFYQTYKHRKKLLILSDIVKQNVN